MAKFAMYLVNLGEGTVHGCNNTEQIRVAIEANEDYPSDNFLIIHATGGQVQQWPLPAREIEELPDPEDDEDSDENYEDDD
jgi:hypothetical protein